VTLLIEPPICVPKFVPFHTSITNKGSMFKEVLIMLTEHFASKTTFGSKKN